MRHRGTILRRHGRHVQKGLKARSQNDRERMYLGAVAALYRDAGAGTKQERDEAYREQMAATHAKYPDNETKLFYGLVDHGQHPRRREGIRDAGPRGRSLRIGLRDTTSSIRGCCTTSFTPTTIPFMPKQVCRLRASMPRRPRRCRTRITCRRTSSRAWATGTRRRPPTRTRGRFQTTM